MNICVTGGAGFIGSHLVDRLIDGGHKVLVLDNLTTGAKENINKSATFLEMDIRDKKLAEVFTSFEIEYVFHEAAQTMVQASIDDPRLDCDVNLLGLINVLEACRKSGVKKIIMPSSAAVYGDNDQLPLKETEHGVPSSFYGLTKLTTEHYLRLYEQLYGFSYICFRYANVYGPRQGNGGEGGVISIFMDNLLHHKELRVYGDGEQTRDFVYVDDVVEANLVALRQADEVAGVFNVCTNTESSVNDLVQTLRDICGEEISVNYLEERPGDIKHSCLSKDKALETLGFEATTTLQTGLLKTYHYFQNINKAKE